MTNMFWIGFLGAIIAGLFAWSQVKKVMSYSEGTLRMQKIAASIREGANAYLKQQKATNPNILLWPISNSARNKNYKLVQTEGWN